MAGENFNAEFYKKFLEAEELEGKSHLDPEEEPFKSLYAARVILEDIEKTFASQIESGGIDLSIRDEFQACYAGILLKLAKNFVNCEERPSGEESCDKATKILGYNDADGQTNHPTHEPNSRKSATYLALLNYLGFIHESRNAHDKARAVLHAGERVYIEYKQNCTEPPSTFEALFPKLCVVPINSCTSQGENDEANDKDQGDNESPRNSLDVTEKSAEELWKNFESLHTHTIYFLAQVYKNEQELGIAASYCEKTLVRQMEFDEYEPVEWALNCATLSQYYIGTKEREHFPQARHCLASAESVIKSAEIKARERLQKMQIEKISDGREIIAEVQMEKTSNCKADVARCWAKYGIALLESSFEKLEENEEKLSNQVEETMKIVEIEDKAEEKPNSDVPENAKKAEKLNESHDASLADFQMKFARLDLTAYENQVTARHVQDFTEARKVFLNVQRWINTAKEFYSVDTHASDYVELCQDNSRLYKALVNFETDFDRKCKMHKRRIDILKEVLDELSPTYFLLVCRQLIFELGETANEMLSLKLDILEVNNPDGKSSPTPHQIVKINLLCDQGIGYFTKFLDSFKELSTDKLPEKFPTEGVRPAILAHFYSARLWGKKLTHDIREKLGFIARSLEEYRWIVNYCDKTDPPAADCVKEELEACRDMVQLLPVKMSRIAQYT